MPHSTLYAGDCLEILPTLDADSVDAVVTDPPYHLTSVSRNGSARVPGNGPAGRHRNGDKGFMGRTWDGGDIAFRPETWASIARALKPGGYLVAFGGTRTFHRIACAIEDGGFVLQDTLVWLYGQGFPKHTSKLKPAWEPILLAWKPGKCATPLPGLDACRIDASDASYRQNCSGDRGHAKNRKRNSEFSMTAGKANGVGRWPANVILDEEAAMTLDRQTGPQKSGGTPPARKAAKTKNCYGAFNGEENPNGIGSSAGNVSRFFYCAKASRKERNEGVTGNNHHPTVKPIELMRYLCRLITPAAGLILDPFLGSGSTGKAAILEGFSIIGIENRRDYLAIARKRIAYVAA